MILQPYKFDVGHLEVNCFVFGCSETRDAALIDIGAWSEDIAEFVDLNDLTVKTIFLTHNHHDHIAGLGRALETFKDARGIAGTPDIDGRKVDRVVKHGDTVSVGNHEGKVVDTSGHTPVGLSLIFDGVVFTGDALFAGSVGGTADPDTYKQQHDLIEKNLFCLPGHYEVHCGHGPSSTIEVERAHNPFFV